MRNAERGSSQVPLVICIVLLLGAAFFAYDENGKRVSIENRLKGIQDAAKDPDSPATPSDDAIKDLITKAHTGPSSTVRLRDLSDIMGFVDDANADLYIDPAKAQQSRDALLAALDTGEFTVEIPSVRYITNPDGGVSITKTGDNMKISYGGTRELRGANPSIQNVMEIVIVPAMRNMLRDLKRYAQAYGSAKTTAETAAAEYATALAAKDEANNQARAETGALESRKAQEIADLRRQKDDAEAQATAQESEKEEAVARLTAQRDTLARQLNMKAEEVKVLKARKRAVETDTSSDGAVTAVAEGGGFVVVNIGKRNNLIAGTNFDVYSIGKGGRQIAKGTIKVIRVDNDTAQAQVMQQYDAYSPLVAGDKIRSLTYDPKETIRVALVGRFSKMGRSDAAARLRALGVTVDESVTVDTHYLVVGSPESESEPIEDTPAFKAAELYGITTISERELSRFTMY